MKILNTLIIIAFLNGVVYSQIGSIRIFSEIPDYTISMDDSIIGQNLKKIDSVSAGVHYVKAFTGNIIAFSELVNVYRDSVSVLLIKENQTNLESKIVKKIVPDKIIAYTLTDDMKKYNAQYLRVKEKTKYIIQTSSRTDQYQYVLSEGTYETTNSTSSAAPVDYLTIVASNGKIVSELEFAQLIKDSVIIKRNLNEKNEIESSQGKRAGLRFFGGLTVIGASIFGIAQYAEGKPIVGPLLVGLGGFLLFCSGVGNTKQVTIHFYPANVLLDKVFEYNQNLKKKLNIAPDYEPIVPDR